MGRGVNDSGTASSTSASIIHVTGRVQGVGFRPFIYRIAQQFRIHGWVQNRQGEVVIHAEGSPSDVAHFLSAITAEAPPFARPEISSRCEIKVEGFKQFTIMQSGSGESAEIHLPPDQFTCNDCIEELHNPADRRFNYPFINCTQCGPRYTIISELPYDRAATSMAAFPLCPECMAEYLDPADRRFHAEPVACPVCGPQLSFTDGELNIDDNDAALQATVRQLTQGGIVAIKGIGGYHLMCDACNESAVSRLRQRKLRPDKPLAVMFPQRGASLLDSVDEELLPTAVEATTLRTPERPIVLCKKKPHGKLAPSIAPGLLEVGAMLPYSPLHHLLLSRFAGPLVATSGNISGEPVITDNLDAAKRLSTIADTFLHHNRPILRPADDSLYRIIHNQPRPLRLGRGMAPLELKLTHPLLQPTLVVGGQMKNSIALGWGERVVISPHIGDLTSLRSQQIFAQVIDDLQQLYQIKIGHIICDAHPGYDSHRWALKQGLPITEVLHHHAHASAIYGEARGEGQWLVFSWDGTGMGADHTLWGGEALIGQPGTWRRFASMRPFYLPGGERAAREPWRCALALLWETGREATPQQLATWHCAADEIKLLHHAWQQQLNSPVSSAVGRLFDGAAALLNISSSASYEGQAPARLEAMAVAELPVLPPQLPLTEDGTGLYRSDWEALIPMLLNPKLPSAVRATLFHHAMAETIVAQAELARSRYPIENIGLAGGVFQNRLLTELAIEKLAASGFKAHLPQTIPSNDGGLCYGQLIEAAALSGDNQTHESK